MKDPFLKLGPEIHPGVFYAHAKKAGYTDYVILMRNPYNRDRLLVDYRVDLNDYVEFQHYYIVDVDESVVGSLLRVRDKNTTADSLTVSRVLLHEDPIAFKCTAECEAGGVLMFTDGAGSYFALSAMSYLPSGKLCITDLGNL